MDVSKNAKNTTNKYNNDEKLYDNQFIFAANKTRIRRKSEKFFFVVLGKFVHSLIPIMRQWEMKDLTKENYSLIRTKTNEKKGRRKNRKKKTIFCS